MSQTLLGETTMLNCLGSAVPGQERIVSCVERTMAFEASSWGAPSTKGAIELS